MAKYRFEYKEIVYGVIDVEADSLEEAQELAECNDGEAFIRNSDVTIGKLIEKIG